MWYLSMVHEHTGNLLYVYGMVSLTTFDHFATTYGNFCRINAVPHQWPTTHSIHLCLGITATITNHSHRRLMPLNTQVSTSSKMNYGHMLPVHVSVSVWLFGTKYIVGTAN